MCTWYMYVCTYVWVQTSFSKHTYPYNYNIPTIHTYHCLMHFSISAVQYCVFPWLIHSTYKSAYLHYIRTYARTYPWTVIYMQLTIIASQTNCTLTYYLSYNRECGIAGCLSSWVHLVQSQCCILCVLGSTCVWTVCRYTYTVQTLFSAYRNSSSVLLRSSVSAAKQNAEVYSTSCIQKKNSLQCIVHTV